MIQLVKIHYEKLLVVLALAAVALGLGWSWRQGLMLQQVQAEALNPAFFGAAHAAPPFAPLVDKQVWSAPPAQSQGGGWLYEVFTPPVIYYQPGARAFTVTSPNYTAEATDTIFGLELRAVKLAPYRLQLAGYIGAPGDYLAAFVSSEVPQTLLGRVGRRFGPLGLTLKQFDVRKVALETEAPGPVYEIAAQAVLEDEQTGREVVLDSRETTLTDTPLAVFQAPDGTGRAREMHEGDTFMDDGSLYRVERIQLYPPEVVVARSKPGLPVPETRILRPAESSPGQLAAARPPAKSIPNASAQDLITRVP